MTRFEIPSLETENLILRGFQESDLQAEYDFFTTERSKFVGGPMTPEQVFRVIASFAGHWLLKGYGFWAIEKKATGQYLGRAGLWNPEGWPEREIGWTLMGNGEGKGVGFEAAKAARDYAYNTLGWTTAISMIDPVNLRSIKLAERLGATFERSFTHERFGETGIYRHPSPEELT